MASIGLIRVIPNDELVRQEQAAQKATEEARTQQFTPLLTGIAAHVTACWQEARDAKQSVLWRLQRAHRALIGEYDPDKKAAIEQFGGSTEYARIVANKIRVVESWLRDIYLGQTDQPWSLNPTPKPNFPPGAEQSVREQVGMDVAATFAVTGQMPDAVAVRSRMASETSLYEETLREEARKTTERMEQVMADQLAECQFEQVLSRFLIDLPTYPTAILKGPVLRRRKRLTWVAADETGTLEPQVQDDIVPEFDRVDPFRAYPAPGAETPQDGYFMEHHTFTRSELYDLIGVPGYDEEAIRAVLQEGDTGSLHSWMGLTAASESLDSVPGSLQRAVYEFDALEFHGPLKGVDLMEWGIDDPAVTDRDATYEACVWMIGSWVIKVQINYDPLGIRPYYATSYERLPGEFWGFALPDILDDIAGIANAAVRALCNNMGMASGPQVGVNIDRMAPGTEITTLTPWQIWQMQDDPFGTQSGKMIEFFQPDSNVNDLIGVIELVYKFADDFSLVPRYMTGSEQATGAGRTASGLSMLMGSASKGLKGVVQNIDTDIFAPGLTKLYNHNMLYHPDSTIKGDAQVVAKGAVSLMRLESLQLRRNEFLQVTNNPVDTQIMGMEGRAEVLHEAAKGLEMNTDKIVPPPEKLRGQLMAQSVLSTMRTGTQGKVGSNEVLGDGSATTDNFSPNSLTP